MPDVPAPIRGPRARAPLGSLVLGVGVTMLGLALAALTVAILAGYGRLGWAASLWGVVAIFTMIAAGPVFHSGATVALPWRARPEDDRA